MSLTTTEIFYGGWAIGSLVAAIVIFRPSDPPRTTASLTTGGNTVRLLKLVAVVLVLGAAWGVFSLIIGFIRDCGSTNHG